MSLAPFDAPTSGAFFCVRLSRPRLVATLALVGLALLLGGCATRVYDVKAHSAARPDTKLAGSYRLGFPQIGSVEQPLYDTVAKLLRSGLAAKGLRETTAPGEADLLILVSCGLGVPTTRQTTTAEPVYMMVPGAVRYETVQVGTTSTGAPIMQTIVLRDPPRQELVGYQDRRSDITTVKKFLRLRAFPSHAATTTGPEAPLHMLWIVEATVEGEDSDPKKFLPPLVAAGMVYAAKSTDGPVLIRLKSTDPDLAALARVK